MVETKNMRIRNQRIWPLLGAADGGTQNLNHVDERNPIAARE
jgi:hypothetical protein